MRVIIIFGIACVLFGCAPMGMISASAPNVDEFPTQELPFRVAGDKEAVLMEIQDYLVIRGLPSEVTIRAPKIFIVTTYIIEPHRVEDRRIRMTAFRFTLTKIQTNNTSPCTSVAVVSITKSRGIHEEIWSIQDSDTKYVSSAYPEIRDLLIKKGCK